MWRSSAMGMPPSAARPSARPSRIRPPAGDPRSPRPSASVLTGAHRLRPAAAGVLPSLPAPAAPPRPDVLRPPRGACRAPCGRPSTRSTASSAAPTRSSTAPGASPPGPARRAALDAWHAELDRGVDAGRSDHPVIAALVDAGARHGCRSTCSAATWRRCASTATTRADRERGRARALHGGQRRDRRADHGAAARRAARRPRASSRASASPSS